MRLLVGDRPLTLVCATGCEFDLSVGRRRVVEAVIVGRRAALDTVLEGAKAAGLIIRVQDAEAGWAERAPNSARRSMAVDVELTDIILR